MGFPAVTSLLLINFFLVFLSATSTPIFNNFPACMSHYANASISNTNVLYSPNNSSYSSILESSIQNLRFSNSTIKAKPQYIITPLHESHIQAGVICSRLHGLQIRVRSGGHDYEGLSYTSNKPFVLIDLFKLREINIDVKDESAWVQAGSTVGEVYYHVAEKSNTMGFPAGICLTMGVGGHISGGGIGTLMRMYGLSADNIEDAYLIDVNGKFLNRASMGEELFWAIRGGGGANFGVIFSWKIKLVRVPSTVTVFTVFKTLEQDATNILTKWQLVVDMFDRRLFLETTIQTVDGQTGNKTVQVTFRALFLGTISELLPLMRTSFPELGLAASDSQEMSWIKAAMYFNGFSINSSTSVMLNRNQQSKNFFKNKSDFVKKAINGIHLEKLWKFLLQEDQKLVIIFKPLGGRVSEISESAIPYPHRHGYLYNVQYVLSWQEKDSIAKNIKSMQKLHKFMTPYVSSSPRAAFLNYKDLDLGQNADIRTSYSKARVWGVMYFKTNFERLARIKGKVDPGNFFWDQQSIPPLSIRN